MSPSTGRVTTTCPVVAACPADSLIAGETDHGGASAIATDDAGNSGLGSVTGIKIDATAPTTSDDAPTGWLDHAVTVHLSPDDNLSGVATTQYLVDGASQPTTGTDVTVDGEGTHEITYWSVDVAGNMETPHQVFVRIDLTPPTIVHTVMPAPNGDGWNNTAAVVHFICNDVLSGVGSCPDDTTVSAETAGTTVLGTVSDAAGNTAHRQRDRQTRLHEADYHRRAQSFGELVRLEQHAGDRQLHLCRCAVWSEQLLRPADLR